MICLRTDYHLQFLRLTDKWRIRWSQKCMDTLPMCLFLKLRLYFVEIMDLVGLTCPIANHVRCGNYATTYADN